MAITDNETTNAKPTNGGRITDEVRRDIDVCTQSGEMFDTVFIVKSALLCDLDRIDAAHEKAIASVMNDALYHANDKDMADLGWVRKNKEHVISHATVEVTPHIDWSRMADELDEFAEIVRGMAGDAE